MAKLKHPNISPFYEWLDHEEIRDVVHRALNMPPGERLVFVKALVPGLVEAIGVDEVEDFLDELAVKARRYDEARTHPGEGRRRRRTPGELIGGATPMGHVHASERRDPDRPGGRYAEREQERELWRDAVHVRPGRRLTMPLVVGAAAVAAAGVAALLAGKARREPPAPGPRPRPRGRRVRAPKPTGAVATDVALAERYDRYAG